MPRLTWTTLKRTLTTWFTWGLPGTIVMGLVVAARLTGSLQGLELAAFDTFLQLRPQESKDDRIILIGFDDIKKTKYPIPEQTIVEVIRTIQPYKPTVIGLHIQQNQISPSGDRPLFADLRLYTNLILTEVVLPAVDQIPAPAGFSDKQSGFVDLVQDADTHVRRLPLGLFNPIDDTYKYSLVIRLAENYLVSRDPQLKLRNGIQDRFAMRFGTTELHRVLKDSGGYVNIEGWGDPELLLNFRHNAQPFELWSIQDLETGIVDLNRLRDRIVIIGITDPKTFSRPFRTAALTSVNSIQIQAHAVSQIISAVLEKRPLLKTWIESWEYLWIVVWGTLAVVWGRSKLSNSGKLIGIGVVQVGLISTSYLLLVSGWWIPIVPVSLLWLINGLGYTAFYKYDWVLRSRLKENQRLVEERQRMIEQIFHVIHNGPLQTLASTLRQLRDNNLPQEKLLTVLENLNTEIRQIGEHAKQETLTKEHSLYIGDGIKLDLKLPIHELLYEVYSYTLERPEFSRFKTLKVAYDFAPIDQPLFSIEQRQSLCRFLEEAVCNVGKHAEAATHLIVTSFQDQDWYTIQVMDDGVGLRTAIEGEGTRYARKIASQFGGKFKREPVLPKGTLCQLTIPLKKSWWQR